VESLGDDPLVAEELTGPQEAEGFEEKFLGFRYLVHSF